VDAWIDGSGAIYASTWKIPNCRSAPSWRYAKRAERALNITHRLTMANTLISHLCWRSLGSDRRFTDAGSARWL